VKQLLCRFGHHRWRIAEVIPGDVMSHGGRVFAVTELCSRCGDRHGYYRIGAPQRVRR
jgi:hypothetical protein